MHAVYLDEYWIMRTEATNAQYARCGDAGACSPPEETGSYKRSSYYGDATYAEYPGVNVNWS